VPGRAWPRVWQKQRRGQGASRGFAARWQQEIPQSSSRFAPKGDKLTASTAADGGRLGSLPRARRILPQHRGLSPGVVCTLTCRRLPFAARPWRCRGGAANASTQDPSLPVPARAAHGDRPQSQHGERSASDAGPWDHAKYTHKY